MNFFRPRKVWPHKSVDVTGLGKTIASLVKGRRQWDAAMRAAKVNGPSFNGLATHLKEETAFGSNPGHLRMFAYLPLRLEAKPALVVVLHGCTQTAAGYDVGAGWSALADRHGFALLLPEQQRSNNPNTCFNWFEPGDTQRGHGEALSLRQMIEKMVVDHGCDRGRIFITGLSAGGAMASVMLACYPDVFAAGAIIAGLPFGAASNVKEAFESMFQSPPRSAAEWGGLVRKASPHDGPWPRISIWHGSDDKTVVPANANEILKQWTALHGRSITRTTEGTVNGFAHRAWLNEAGDELIESYSITGMAHGTPLATGAADTQGGSAGPFFLDVGINSSYRIAHFFGLVGEDVSDVLPERPVMGSHAPPEHPSPPVLHAKILEGEILDKDFDVEHERQKRSAFGSIDIAATISKALKAAGLMKS